LSSFAPLQMDLHSVSTTSKAGIRTLRHILLVRPIDVVKLITNRIGIVNGTYDYLTPNVTSIPKLRGKDE
jgi:hypothetical protein